MLTDEALGAEKKAPRARHRGAILRRSSLHRSYGFTRFETKNLSPEVPFQANNIVFGNDGDSLLDEGILCV